MVSDRGVRNFCIAVALVVLGAVYTRAVYWVGETVGRQQMPTACTGDSLNPSGIRDRGTLRLQPQHRKGP